MEEMPYNPFRPWRHPLRLWRVIAYDLTGLITSTITFALVFSLLVTSVSLLITFVIALPFAWVLFVTARWFGWLERSRVAAMAGVRIADPVPPLAATSWFARFRERARSGTRWREIAFHIAHLPVAVITFSLTTAAWAGSLAMLALPGYVDALPGDSAKFYFFELTSGPGAWAAAGVGAFGAVIVAPWVTIGLGRMNLALARALARAERRGRARRAGDAAGDEPLGRRRQRRGRAPAHRARPARRRPAAAGGARRRPRRGEGASSTSDPEAGRELVAAAHEEAKAALKEIRDLVRGIHPVILEDRGLDAALSAIVARSPVPVVTRRGRRRAATGSRRERGLLRGDRGAHQRRQARQRHEGRRSRSPAPATGSWSRCATTARAAPIRQLGIGLQGLRDRVAGLGGSMYVISPPGGPTTLVGGAAVRIVIAEDSVLLRAGLTRILADAGEEVVATVGDADELFAAVERHQPDLALVDVRMPPTHTDDGLRAALAIRDRWPHDRHPRAVAVRRGALRQPSCSPATPMASATC